MVTFKSKLAVPPEHGVRLTRVVGAQVQAFAAVVLGLGPEVHDDSASVVGFDDRAEDLLARPQTPRLRCKRLNTGKFR